MDDALLQQKLLELQRTLQHVHGAGEKEDCKRNGNHLEARAFIAADSEDSGGNALPLGSGAVSVIETPQDSAANEFSGSEIRRGIAGLPISAEVEFYESKNAAYDAVLDECEVLSQRIQESISTDILTVPTAVQSHGFASKTTIGLMLSGKMVDNCVLHGPAYNSRSIERGDEILMVDGEPVGEHNIVDKIIGTDRVGTCVTLTIRKEGTNYTMDVTLNRISSEAIADRRRMFEIFTFMKDRAIKDGDRPLTNLIDNCVDLWTRMWQADADHDAEIVANVQGLQHNCRAWVESLRRLLMKLHAEHARHLAFQQNQTTSRERLCCKLEEDVAHREQRLREKEEEATQTRARIGDLEGGMEKLRSLVERKRTDVMQRIVGRLTHHTHAVFFDTWRSNAQQSKAVTGRVKKLLLRWMHLRLQQVWDRWWEVAEHKHGVRAKVVARWSSMTLWRAFDQWQSAHEEGRRHRAIRLTIIAKWMSGVKGSAFYSWADRVAYQQEVLRKVKAVVTHWTKRSMVKAFNVWHVAVMEECRHRLILGAIVRRWRKLQLAVPFSSWRRGVEEGARLRSAAVQVIDRWAHKGQWGAFLRWCEAVQERAQHRQAADKIVRRWHNCRLWAALHRWTEVVTEHRRLASVALKVITRWQNQRLAAAFGRFAENSATERLHKVAATRIISKWRGGAVSRALERWKERVEEHRGLVLVATQIVLRWRKLAVAQAFASWVGAADHAAAKREEQRTEEERAAQAQAEQEQSSQIDELLRKLRDAALALEASEKLAGQEQVRAEKLKSEVTQLQQRCETAERELTSERQRLADAEHEIETSEAARGRFEADMASAQKQCEEDLKRARHECDEELKRAQKKMEEDLGRAQQKLREAEEGLRASEERREESEQRVKAQAEQLAAKEGQLAAKEGQLAAKEGQLAEKSKKIEEQSKQFEEQSRQVEEKSKKIEEQSRQIEEQSKQIEEVDKAQAGPVRLGAAGPRAPLGRKVSVREMSEKMRSFKSSNGGGLSDFTHSGLLEYLRGLTNKLIQAIRADVLQVDTKNSASGFSTKSTVGMMLDGTTIDNMVLGGPAYNSQQLSKGDVITRVDGTAVAAHVSTTALHDLLIGEDEVGSLVRVQVNGSTEVVLTRMASAAIADKRGMFELFTKLKVMAAPIHDAEFGKTVDASIDLWTKMLLADADHDNKIVDNVMALEEQCEDWLVECVEILEALRTEQGEHASQPLSESTVQWLRQERERDEAQRERRRMETPLRFDACQFPERLPSVPDRLPSSFAAQHPSRLPSGPDRLPSVLSPLHGPEPRAPSASEAGRTSSGDSLRPAAAASPAATPAPAPSQPPTDSTIDKLPRAASAAARTDSLAASAASAEQAGGDAHQAGDTAESVLAGEAAEEVERTRSGQEEQRGAQGGGAEASDGAPRDRTFNDNFFRNLLQPE